MTREQKEPAGAKEKKQTPIDDEMMNPLTQEPETTPPDTHMTSEASDEPVAQEKQSEPVKKQPEPEDQPMKMNDLMQDYAKTVEQNYNQFKKEMERIQKHGTHKFVITNKFAENMKEICEKMGALNALMPDSVNIQPIRKRIQMVIKNCRELFTKDTFSVQSTPIELFGFKWCLEATSEEKGFLSLFLHALPPNGYKENYRIEVDYRFSILNAFTEKDLIEEDIGLIYTNVYTNWGFSEMANFEDLLDPSKTFLTPEGDSEICVDFTIKSSTLNHLT